jgi:hypothetical protein
MAITEQDRQVLIANEHHMTTAKDGWVQQVYDLTKLHEIYERNVGIYPLTTWCPSCVIKFMQRLGTWWDGAKEVKPQVFDGVIKVGDALKPHQELAKIEQSIIKQKRRK